MPWSEEVLTIHQEEQVLMITENGFRKASRLRHADAAQSRGTMGQICYKDNEKTGKLIGAIAVSPEYDIVCITRQGKTLKCNTQEVSEQGRAAMGVRILGIAEDDAVVGLARALKEEEQPVLVFD